MGPITYIVSPKHRFREDQALEQLRVVERLTAFFEVPVFPIRFYTFTAPADLYTAKGYTYHPLMHTIASGGMVDGTGNVYSGNDKDIMCMRSCISSRIGVSRMRRACSTKGWPR